MVKKEKEKKKTTKKSKANPETLEYTYLFGIFCIMSNVFAEHLSAYLHSASFSDSLDFIFILFQHTPTKNT